MERFKYGVILNIVMREKSAFLEFIGDTSATRLLDFLVTGREFDYTLTDLANKAGVSWTTLHRIFPQFIKNKIVLEVRQIGRAKLYKLNVANLRVKKVIDLYDSIIVDELKRLGLKSQKPVLVEV